MPKLINAQTLAAEEIPQDQIGQAFLSGTHNLPSGEKISLNDPDGNPVSVDAHEVYAAVTKGGYSFPSESQLHESALQGQYGDGIGNELKAAALGAASTVPLAVPGLVKSGIVSKEAATELPKRNPWSSGAGALAGIGTQLALAPELSPAGLISKGGAAITRAAEGALGTGSTILSRAATSGLTKGLGLATEGAAYGTNDVVTEALLGDPDLTAQRAVSEIGMSALFAGGLGAALGIPEAIFPKHANVESVISGIKDDMAAAAPDAVAQSAPSAATDAAGMAPGQAGSLETAIDSMNVPPAKKQSFLEGLQQLKPNSQEIIDAAKEIDAPVLESQVSASKHVQDLDSMLMQSPTVVGVERQQLVQKGVDAATNAVEDTLASSSNLTKAEVGNAIKQGITERLDAERKPIEDLYSSIKEHYEYIPVSEKSTKRIAANILKIDGIGLSPSSPEYQLAKSVAEELPNLKTVDHIKQYTTILGRRTQASPELRYVAGQIREKLANLEENATLRFARDNFKKGSPGSERILDLIDQRASANKAYTALRDKMSELGDVLGKRKIYGPQDFLNFIEDLTPEKLSDKLFAKNNSEFVEFFQKEFPKEMQLLRDLQKNRIAGEALKDGKVMAGKALKQIDKFSPEIQKALFSPSELKKLGAAKTWLEALPENINPSKTSKSEAYRRHFTNPIAAAVETAKDAVTKKGLNYLVDTTGGKDAPRIHTLINLERKANSTTKAITSKAKAIFRGAGRMGGAIGNQVQKHLPKDNTSQEEQSREYEDHTNQLRMWAQNPESFLDTIHRGTIPLYPHAPNVTGGMQRAASNAVGYLNSKLPQAAPPKPISKPQKPSNAEMYRFNRSWHAIENPTSILDQLKKGVLTHDAVQAVQTVHPELYQEMQSAVMEELSKHGSDNIPYRTRMMLSVFMQQDMDGSLNPQSIMANQLSINGPNQKSPQDQVQGPMGKPTKGGLAKLNVASQSLTPFQAASQRRG